MRPFLIAGPLISDSGHGKALIYNNITVYMRSSGDL
jgi:hypothetical protein